MTECDQQVSPFCHIWPELLISKCILFYSFVLSTTASSLTRTYGFPIRENTLTAKWEKAQSNISHLQWGQSWMYLPRTDATKKKFLAGRGGIGVSSVEDWKQCPSWLASSREDGCRGDSRASVWKHSTVCHVQRRLAGVSPRLSRRSVPLGFVGGDKTTWGRRLYRSWGRGSGLQSQADGTTTPIKTHSSTLYTSTSGCFCYVSPSRFTWWAVFAFFNPFIASLMMFLAGSVVNVSYQSKCPRG